MPELNPKLKDKPQPSAKGLAPTSNTHPEYSYEIGDLGGPIA